MGNVWLRKSGLLFTTLFLTAGMLAAQHPTTRRSADTSTRTAKRTMSDQSFAKKAAESGTAEVKLGKLAEQKGHVTAVRDFGKRMVNDHSKANEKLKSAASQANISLPKKMSPKEQAAYNRLSKLSGPAFDHAYARLMLKNHQHAVAVFRREAKHGKKQPIKRFASNTVPVLEQHLALARQMNRDVHPGTARGHQRRPAATKTGTGAR